MVPLHAGSAAIVKVLVWLKMEKQTRETTDENR
jgi:hypothetical protein